MHKNVWENLEGNDAAHVYKQLKKAEIMRFKDLHWGSDRYDKWSAADRKRQGANRKKKGRQQLQQEMMLFKHFKIKGCLHSMKNG